MKSILKTVKQLETTNEVLEYIENVISKIKDSEFTKNILDIDNDFILWQRIEIIANKIAIKKAKSPEELEAMGAGTLRIAAREGDVDNGSVMIGQIAGMIKDIKTVDEIIQDIVNGIPAVLRGIEEKN